MLTMATSNKGYFPTQKHHFLPLSGHRDSLTMDSDSNFEFDESDIYNSGRANSFEFRASLHGAKKASSTGDRAGAPASLPVNIPDWSKILGDEYRDNRRKNSVIDNEDEDYDVERSRRLPPHEFLARTRVASFSVHEGVGRTLKGRDLSRVRNAIWAKTGFQD